MAGRLSTDLSLPPSTPNLHLPKHIHFLANFGTPKDDYVRHKHIQHATSNNSSNAPYIPKINPTPPPVSLLIPVIIMYV